MNPANPALKPYLEKIEKICQPLDKAALTRLVLEMARQVKPGERGAFLGSLAALLSAKQPRAAIDEGESVDRLLAEIGELGQGILDRISSIEDGTYWDEPEEDWDDGYDEEGPDLLSEEQQAGLAELFSEAGQLFLGGAKVAAGQVYGALLALVNEAQSDYVLDWDVDLKEARVRYARCVYESAAEGQRVQEMQAAMEIDLENGDDEESEDYPFLQDVIDADTGALAGFNRFLPAWRRALEEKDFHQDRVAELWLEAAFMQEAAAGVARLARAWGAQQPRGSLGWLRRLEDAGDWPALRDACREVLDMLPHGRERGQAAASLVLAGKKLGQDEVILAGFREQFRSQPYEPALLALMTEANRQQTREQELSDACAFLAGQKTRHGEKLLLVKALLMAGRIDEAFSLGARDKAIGWSSSDGGATGLLFAALLHLSCGGHAGCGQVNALLRDQADRFSFDPFSIAMPEEKAGSSAYPEILRGLGLINPASLDLDHYWQWARKIGEKRVNRIVSEKHRGAYDRAASVLAALAEVMSATGKKQEALALLQDYCKVRFNRHVAFRREVRQAAGASSLLRSMAAGL